MLALLALAPMALAQHSVTLSWQPGTTGTTPTGYNVKRATVAGGPYTTIGSTTTVLTFTDASTTVQVEGSKWFYVITATANGAESGPSNEVSAIIPFSPPSPPSLDPPVVK